MAPPVIVARTDTDAYNTGAGADLAENFTGGLAPGRCRLSSARKYICATTRGQLALRNLDEASIKTLQRDYLCWWQNWGGAGRQLEGGAVPPGPT